MAQSLETLRNNIVTHVFGRRLGLHQDDTIVGPKDLKRAVQDLTSASTATALNNYGIVNINVTSAATTAAGGVFLLSNPIPGVAVEIYSGVKGTTSTQGSTSVALLRPSTAFLLLSSEGTTNVAAQIAFGMGVRLIGITTDAYQIGQRSGSTAGFIVAAAS